MVFVRESRLEEFEEALKRADGLELTDKALLFGSCYGERASDVMKNQLWQRYGVLGKV